MTELTLGPKMHWLVVDMAHANGLLDRTERLGEVLEHALEVFEDRAVDQADLDTYDEFLAELSDADMCAIAEGDEEDREHILQGAPSGLNAMIEAICHAF